MAADYAAVKSMVERGVGRGYTHCLIVVDESIMRITLFTFRSAKMCRT